MSSLTKWYSNFDLSAFKLFSLFLILNAINVFVKTLFPSNSIDFIMTIIFITSFTVAFFKELKNIKNILSELFLYEFIGISLILLTLLRYTDNWIAVLNRCSWFLIFGLPLFTLIKNMKNTSILVEEASRIVTFILGLCVLLVIFIYAKKDYYISSYNMSLSYLLVYPTMVYLCRWNKSKFNSVLAFICVYIIFMYGARGPLLVIGIGIILLFLNSSSWIKLSRKLFLLLILFLVLLIFKDSLLDIIREVATYFGIKSRTLALLLDSHIYVNSGRSDIYQNIIYKIMEHPLIGWGIAGEVSFMVSYPHSIILEILLHFGLPLGILFLACILFKIYKKFIVLTWSKELIIFFSCGVIPLFLSNTYLKWILFWCFLGILFNRKTNSRKIVVIFPHLGIGGIPKSLAFVANTIKESKYDVTCISLTENEKTISLDNSIPIINLNLNLKNINQLNRINRIKNKMMIFLKLRKCIIQNKFDNILVFGCDMVWMIALATFGLNLNIIGSERGNPYEYTKFQKKKYFYAVWQCHTMVFQSEGAKAWFDWKNYTKYKIIPNPAILRNGKVKIENIQLRERHNNIITCGRLSKEKNFDLLIEAFIIVNKRYPNYNLIIYGDGPECNNLLNLINYNNLTNVKIINNVSNVFEGNENAAMFILPSKFEGMPNALMEAMLTGIPCLASDCPPGGVRKISNNGKRVKLFEVNDINSMVEAIILLIENKEYALELAKLGKEISIEYNPNNIKNKWKKVFDDINR